MDIMLVILSCKNSYENPIL